MIKKKLVLSKDLLVKKAMAMPELTLGDKLNKMGKLLILFPDEAKAPLHGDKTGLSNVAWLYNTARNAVAHKLAHFADYLDSGGNLDGRSWYLMVDMFKISAYLYERESQSIISDSSFDRLGRFLETNIQQLVDRQIIPRLINREAVTGTTGMDAAYSLTDKDIELAKLVLIMVGVFRNGNKEKSDGREGSAKRDGNTGNAVRGSAANAGTPSAGIVKTYKLLKRPPKK